MEKLWQYYGNFQSARGSFGGLPSWARAIVFLMALPGIALAVLSLVGLLVSILALLLLTVPAYRVLRSLTGTDDETRVPQQGEWLGGAAAAPARRKQVEATVVDSAPGVDET